MLFSNEQVAAAINDKFEAAWESVRPVPIVRIDFGNGNVITRTLHGNIATYVCAADGQVLDVLPGIYSPKPYLAQLNRLRLLAATIDLTGRDKRDERLRLYHQSQVQKLKKRMLATVLAEAPPVADRERPNAVGLAPVTKGKIERPVEAVVAGPNPAALRRKPVGKAVIEAPVENVVAAAPVPRVQPYNGAAVAKKDLQGALRRAPVGKGMIERPVELIVAKQAQKAIPQASAVEAPRSAGVTSTEGLAEWKALAEDTELNETVRRWQIHSMLLATGNVKPERITKPLYKNVLHADIDDPYMGLGPTLFATYPFAKEDK